MSIPWGMHFAAAVSSNIPAWQKIISDLQTSGYSFVHIPRDLVQIFGEVTIHELNTLSMQYHKRLVITSSPVKISSTFNNNPITLIGHITSLSSEFPAITSFISKCPRCKTVRQEHTRTPIDAIPLDVYECNSEVCRLSSKNHVDPQFTFIDCRHVTIQTNHQSIPAYIINNPTYGYCDLQTKILQAISKRCQCQIHGFLHITTDPTSSHHRWVLEISDIDLCSDDAVPVPLVTCQLSVIPNNEKQAVMSGFFGNLAFMQQYFDFTSYTLQDAYPDLTIHNARESRTVEFEFDVANFFAHKHHISPIHTDILIAWQNTSRQTYPCQIVLLPDLNGVTVPQAASLGRPIWEDICDILQFFFPHRPKTAHALLACLLLPTPCHSGLYRMNEVILQFTDSTPIDRDAWARVNQALNITTDRRWIQYSAQHKPLSGTSEKLVVPLQWHQTLNVEADASHLAQIERLQASVFQLWSQPVPMPSLTPEAIQAIGAATNNNIDWMNVTLLLAKRMAWMRMQHKITDRDVIEVWQWLKAHI